MNIPVLICAFHDIEALKSRLSRLALNIDKKHQIFMLFGAILYSGTQERLDETRAAFRRDVPKGLVRYHEKRWESMFERWIFFHRKDLQTLGNMVTNRIERFFHILKDAMRGGGRRRGGRMHLEASIRVLVAVVSYKTTV